MFQVTGVKWRKDGSALIARIYICQRKSNVRFFFFRNAEKILIIVIDYCDMYGRINIVNAFHVAYIEICLQPYIYGQPKKKTTIKLFTQKYLYCEQSIYDSTVLLIECY